MQLFENISMAFASVRSNKMRSLLTMLGIIIGIAAVIAIVTVGNSMTGSVTDSMSGMGVSNITVSVQQKSSSNTQGTAQGVTLRRFMDTIPGDSDLITDAMINDFYAAFPDEVDHFEYTVDVGQTTIAKYGDPTTTIKTSVSGVNHATLTAKDDDSQILYGRWLDDDKDAGRMLACVSEKFITQAIGGSAQDAIGKSFTLTGSDGNLYTYFIVGVYKYTEDSYSSMFGSTSDDDIQTNIYIPLDVARSIAGTASGYQSFTVVAASGVDVTSFVDTVGDFFASYFEPGGKHDLDAEHGIAGHLGHCSHFPAGRRHRCHEHYDGLCHRAHARDRHPQGTGCPGVGYPNAVYHRKRDPLSDWRHDRGGFGHCCRWVKHAHAGAGQTVGCVDSGRCWVQHGHWRIFWVLPRQQGREA